MQLITRKNFFTIVCISFTISVLIKVIWEKIIGFTDPHYIENTLLCLGISVFITFILAIHYYLQRFPFIPVFLGQYLVTVALTFAFIAVTSQFAEIAPTAYWDMFISVTIPFMICACIYYMIFFHQIKKANKMFESLSSEG